MANKEYIEREAAIEAVCENCNKIFPEEPCEPSDCAIMQMLRSIPAADVVERASGIIGVIPTADVRPVVLCRDCKYSYDSVCGWCCSHGICVDCIVREDFFCADGEKREEN